MDPITPLQDLLANPRYSDLAPDKKVEAIRNWEYDTIDKRNASGEWDMETKAIFDVESTQARQAALGIEPMSPRAILESLAGNEEEDRKTTKLFEALEEVEAAEREKREINSLKFRTIGEDYLDRNLEVADDKIRAIGKRVGFTDLENARQANEVVQNKRDSAVVRGKLVIKPDLYFDREAFVDTVKNSSATPREKARVLSEFTRSRENLAKETMPEFQRLTSFRNFSKEFAAANPDTTNGDVIEAFKRSGNGDWEKTYNAMARGLLSGVEGVGYTGVLVGDILKKMGDQSGSFSTGIGETLGLAKAGSALQDLAIDGPAGLADTSEAKQAMSRDIETLGGLNTAQKLAEVGAQLGVQIFASMATGAVTALPGAIIQQGAKKAAKTAASNVALRSLGKEAAKKIMAKGAARKLSADEFMSVINTNLTAFAIPAAGSAGPKFYESYERHRDKLAASGLAGEELEEAARSNALTDATRTGIVTGVVTRIFGLHGVEGIGRLTQIAANPTARKALSVSAKQFAKQVGKGSVGEGFEEALDEGINGALDALLENPDMTYAQWEEQVLFAGFAGTVFGAAVEVPTQLMESAAYVAKAQIANSPEMVARNAKAAELREQGLDGLADTLEEANVATESAVFGDALDEIETDVTSTITRIDEIDIELQAEATGLSQDKIQELRTERETLLASLDQGTDPSTYNPEAVANTAVANLVSNGMDPAEARTKVVSVVNQKYSATPVTDDLLAAEAESVPVPPPTNEATTGIPNVSVSPLTQNSPGSPYYQASINIEGKDAAGHVSIKKLDDGTAVLSDIQIGYEGDVGRGKGHGTLAYAEIGKQLANMGITLQSTRWSKHQTSISPQALKVWAKLEAMGLAKQTGSDESKVYNRQSGEDSVEVIPEYEFVPANTDGEVTAPVTADLLAAEAEGIPLPPVEGRSPNEEAQVTNEAPTSRNTDLFPDSTDFAGKLPSEANIKSYTENEGIGTAIYENPENGSEDVFISAFGDNDFVAYIRIYDEQGNPTNRFASKLERRSKRDGATRSMMEELQSRLPKNHEYTEDVSVSTDGLNFISSQLTKGYELLTDASGKPETNRIAINGESITNPLGEDVLREGDAFQDIRVTNQKQFERVRSYLSPLMEKFGAGLTSKNIFWENGRVYVDMPVLRKVNTDQASESSTDTPLTKTSKGNAVNQTNEVTTPVTPAPAPAPAVAEVPVEPPVADSIEEVVMPTSKFSPLNNALARNKNLIQSLASLGVEVKVVKDGAAAEAFIGRKMKRRGGRGFTTRTAAGVPVIVLLEDRIVTNRANLDKLIQHEAIHAAHFAMRSADATMDDAAITELLSDTTLQRKMSRIYKGFEDLAPESQIAEVVVALNLGTLTTAQVPSSLLDYIAQFLAYMQGNLVNVSPEIKTLVDSVLGKLQGGEVTLQNTVYNTPPQRTNPTPDDAGRGATPVSPEPVETSGEVTIQNTVDNSPDPVEGGGMTPTPTEEVLLSSLTKDDYVNVTGEQYQIVGTEDDGRVVVSNRTGGYLTLPTGTTGTPIPVPVNPYASVLSNPEPDFEFLNRLGAVAPPAGLETIPGRDLPLGTVVFSVGTSNSGNLPPIYAVTSEGLIYSDRGRSMTHGGASPWRLEYVTGDYSSTTPQATLSPGAAQTIIGARRLGNFAGPGNADVSPEPVAATAAEGVTPGPVAPTLEEVRARDSEAARLSREGGDTIEDETLVSDYLDGNTGPLMSRLREVGDVNLDLYPGPQGIDVATEAVNEVLTEMQSEGVPLSDEDVTRLTEAYRSEVTPTPPLTFDPDTTPLDASPVVRQPKQTRGALDDQYFSAIEAGDMDAVQRMVDEAAKAAGYGVGPVNHRTLGNFTVFDLLRASKSAVWGPAIYASFDANWNPSALSGGKNISGYVGGKVIDFTKPITPEDAAILSNFLGREIRDSMPFITLEKRYGSVAEGLKAAGYSAAIHNGPGSTGRHIAVFSPNQIKSADPITYDAQGNIIPLSQRFNPDSDSILEAQTSTNFTAETDWTDVVTSLVNRAIQKYPNIPIKADTTSSSLARTQGLDMTINPVMMAESTAGMGPAEAAQIIDKIIIHEATHRAALTDLDPEFPNQYAAQMTVDEKLDTARGYLHRSAYATDEAYNTAVREFAGVEGNTDARTVNFKLGHEALRMLSERMRTGYTTEETIAFLKMNPNLLQRAIRYLKAYVNRLKAWATTRKDPTLYAEMSTLNKAVWEMENGPYVERGAEPFVVPGSQVTPAPMPRTVFNSVLGREIAVAASPLVEAPIPEVVGLPLAESIQQLRLPTGGLLEVRGPSENVTTTMQANGKDAGAKVGSLPISSVNGIIRLNQPEERARVDALKEKMLSDKGFIASILVDADGDVIEGQHRLAALSELGAETVPVVVLYEAGDFIPDVSTLDKVLADSGLHRDQRSQMISSIGEILMDENGDFNELENYDAPSGFAPQWQAAMAEIERQLSINTPILEASPFGKPSRVPVFNRPEAGKYKEGGWLTAAFRWDPRVFEMLQKSRNRFQSLIKEAEFFHKDLNAQLKKAFGSKKDLWPVDTVNLALGNTDNRMTEANVEEIKRIKSRGLAAAQGDYLRARALAKQQDDAGMVADAALTRQDARATFDSAIAAYKDRARVYEDQARIDARVRAEADRDAAITSLPDDVQVTVRKMRLAIDALSAELVRSGLLPDDLKATIDANQGLWLHRSYRIFDQENYAEWIQESKDPEAEQLRNKTLTFVRDDLIRKEADKQMAKNPGMTRAQAKINAATVVTNEDVTKAFNGFLHIADGGVKSLLAGATISKDVDALMKRGVIPKEIQELWGVYTDPTVNAAKSLGAVAQFVTQQEFLSNLVDLGTSEGWLSKDQYDAQGNRLYELAPNNGMSGRYNGSPSTQWAPLSGYYGPRALADAISATAKDLGGPAWLKTVMQLTGYSMASKTVLSWQSVMRNFWGNILFTVANGNVLTWNAWKTMNKSRQAAWSNFYGSGSEATRARVKRMIELGVFGDAMTENLLRDLTNGFGSDKKAIRFFDKMAQKTFLSKLTGGANKVFKTSARFYSAPDEFWKVVAFEGEMGRVAKYMPNATVEQQEEEAARIVKSTMPTYSQAPEIVQLLRRNPFIAPFITFTTEVYRTSINTVKLTAGQIAEGHKTKNTALAMDGYQRLLGVMLASAGVYGVTLLLRSMAGFDDKDEDDLRNHVPVWDENATLMILPTDRSDGKIDYMNVSYFNPYDVWSRPLRAFFRGLRDPDSGLLDTIGETIQEFFDPVLSEQIFIGSVLDVARGVTLSGKELYDDQDTKIDKITQSLTHIFKQSLMPGTASSAERIIKASTGYVAPGSGRSYEKWKEIFSGTLGMKFSSLDTSSTLQFSAKQFKANRSDSIYTFSKPFKSNGTQSDADIADAYIKANAKLKRSQLELYKKMTSAVRLGTMTQREALRQMQADGVTDEVVRDILQNRFRRYEPSTRDLNEAKRKGDKLGQDRIAIYRSVRDEVPPVEKLSEDEL